MSAETPIPHPPDQHWLGVYKKETVPWPKLTAGLRAFFGIDTGSAGKYACSASLMLRKAKLDIMALDDWLIERHGEYDGSMADFIAREYGDEARAFVEAHI
jgi:hypothetical protein